MSAIMGGESRAPRRIVPGNLLRWDLTQVMDVGTQLKKDEDLSVGLVMRIEKEATTVGKTKPEIGVWRPTIPMRAPTTGTEHSNRKSPKWL